MFKSLKSIYDLNWIYFFIILIIFWIGEINLYSAAGGSFDPWAYNQLIRFHTNPFCTQSKGLQ